mgnify:CR=1 FL=1
MLRPHPARRMAFAGLLALVVALATGSCGSSDASEGRPASTTAKPADPSTDATAPAGAAGAVVKDILGTEVDPPGAPGRTLTLIRYTIPPGAALAPHIHPGVQLASIRSGRLTYNVVDGVAIVRRAGATTDEKLVGPTSTVLRPGDAVTEVDGMVHFGANDTKKPIVIEATLITKTGEDLAVPVSTSTTTTVGG